MSIQLANILRVLLNGDLLGVLRGIIGAIKRLIALVWDWRLQGIYEVLEQTRTVEIHDAGGRFVTVETVQRVRFCQNQVVAITDYAWGDGEIYAEYQCSPGVPVDCYREGAHYVVLISLREHKNRGDTLCFRIRRAIRGGFTRPRECWESEVYHRTRMLVVKIIFPVERKCQRATVTWHNARKMVALGPEHVEILPDGRQQLRWEMSEPKLYERYLLTWEW